MNNVIDPPTNDFNYFNAMAWPTAVCNTYTYSCTYRCTGKEMVVRCFWQYILAKKRRGQRAQSLIS